MNFAYVGCAPQIIMPLDGLVNIRDTPRGWYRTIHADPTELTRSCGQFRHNGEAHGLGRSSVPPPNKSRATDSSRTELPDPGITLRGRSSGTEGSEGGSAPTPGNGRPGVGRYDLTARRQRHQGTGCLGPLHFYQSSSRLRVTEC